MNLRALLTPVLVAAVLAGDMDLYLFGLRTEAAQEWRVTEGVELIDAPATQGATCGSHDVRGRRPGSGSTV